MGCAQNTVTNLAMLKVEQVRTTAFDSELLFLNVVQVLDFVRICVWSRMRCARGFRLKILVSAVRFRPRPPKFSAQLFSVGRFHLCFPHDTRGSRTFCVCDQAPVAWQEHPRLPSVPPSLLSKSALTSSPWHTHMAFCDHDLCACHCHSLSGLLGAAVRHANTAAAQGMEYKPARCCVTTSAP